MELNKFSACIDACNACAVACNHCAASCLQESDVKMMVKCIERGIPRYNLYGINGLFTPENNPGFGVLEFKQRFNGFVEEMPGEFVLPVKPLVYAAKQLAHKLLHR